PSAPPRARVRQEARRAPPPPRFAGRASPGAAPPAPEGPASRAPPPWEGAPAAPRVRRTRAGLRSAPAARAAPPRSAGPARPARRRLSRARLRRVLAQRELGDALQQRDLFVLLLVLLRHGPHQVDVLGEPRRREIATADLLAVTGEERRGPLQHRSRAP